MIEIVGKHMNLFRFERKNFCIRKQDWVMKLEFLVFEMESGFIMLGVNLNKLWIVKVHNGGKSNMNKEDIQSGDENLIARDKYHATLASISKV